MQIGSAKSYQPDPRPNAYRRGYGGRAWRGRKSDGGLGGLRGRIYRRDHGRCQECGRLCVPCHHDVGCRPSIDHIIPKSRGGTDDLANLRLLCVACNSAKRDRLPGGGKMIQSPEVEDRAPSRVFILAKKEKISPEDDL